MVHDVRMQFHDSVIAVTGGASGLGEGVIRRAVSCGARAAVILDVNKDQAEKLMSDLGASAHYLPCDVTNTEQIHNAIAKVIASFRRLDVAVACAGVGLGQRTLSKDGSPASIDDFRRVVDINLVGTFDFVRHAASAMQMGDSRDNPAERGVIVMTSSSAAFEGQVGQVAYSASKGGIVGMTTPLARDLSSAGIRVVTIAPGLMDTPIYAQLGSEVKDRLTGSTVFPKRFGLPDEFAHMVQSVVENAYMNGEVVRIHGATHLPPR